MIVKHSEMVKALAKPGKQILEEMTEDKFGRLLSAVSEGIDAGSWVDSVKKEVFYNKSGWSEFKSLPIALDDLTKEKCHLLHMAMGVFGEASEVLEVLFAHIYQKEELDKELCIEELGDLEFYMEGLRQGLGFSRKKSLKHNVKKLSKRYEGLKYSDQSAKLRKDKA